MKHWLWKLKRKAAYRQTPAISEKSIWGCLHFINSLTSQGLVRQKDRRNKLRLSDGFIRLDQSTLSLFVSSFLPHFLSPPIYHSSFLLFSFFYRVTFHHSFLLSIQFSFFLTSTSLVSLPLLLPLSFLPSYHFLSFFILVFLPQKDHSTLPLFSFSITSFFSTLSFFNFITTSLSPTFPLFLSLLALF